MAENTTQLELAEEVVSLNERNREFNSLTTHDLDSQYPQVGIKADERVETEAVESYDQQLGIIRERLLPNLKNILRDVPLEVDVSPTYVYQIIEDSGVVVIQIPAPTLGREINPNILEDQYRLEKIKYAAKKRLFDFGRAKGLIPSYSEKDDGSVSDRDIYFQQFEDGKDFALSSIPKKYAQGMALSLLDDDLDAFRPDPYDRNKGTLQLAINNLRTQDFEGITEFFKEKKEKIEFCEKNGIHLEKMLKDLTVSIRKDLRLERAHIYFLAGQKPSAGGDKSQRLGSYDPPLGHIEPREKIYLTEYALSVNSTDALLNLIIADAHEHYHAYQFRRFPKAFEITKSTPLVVDADMAAKYYEDMGEQASRMYSYKTAKEFVEGYPDFSSNVKDRLLKRLEEKKQEILAEGFILPEDK
jgi:hypothetical protein